MWTIEDSRAVAEAFKEIAESEGFKVEIHEELESN